MNNNYQPPPAGVPHPLSYEDLRRFLLLVVSLILFAALALFLAKLLVLFAVVFFLAMILNPLVSWLEKRGVKRGLAVALIILTLLGLGVALVSLMVPPILDQVEGLAKRAPEYWNKIRIRMETLSHRYPALDSAMPEMESLMKAGQSRASSIGTWVLRSTFGLMGGLFMFVFALLLLVFTLSNPRPLVAGFLGAVPERHREAAGRSLARVMQQMMAWTKATLIMGAITGVSTGVLLHLVGVQPAFLFGTLAFFGEFVPNIGPVVMSVPALFVALGTSPTTFMAALAVILFVQQVESNVLVPFIMGRQMELHPVTIVFFALSMGSLFGAAGAVLAVPIAATVKILFDEFYLLPQRVPVENLEERSGILIAERTWPDTGSETESPSEEDKIV